MRKIFVLIVMAVVSDLLVAAQGQTASTTQPFQFESIGNDTYADGTPVLAGECYALAWQRTGTAFPGFSAEPLDPRQPAADFWVACYFPVAEHDPQYNWSWCPQQVISGIDPYSATTGVWTVYLLDTRYLKDDGSVACGFDAKRESFPRCINAYKALEGLTGIELKLYPASPFISPKEAKCQSDQTADQTSYVPTDCPTPQFATINKGNGEVTLSVTNTAPYLAYDISMTNDLAKVHSTTNFVGGAQQGVGGAGVLTWTIPVGTEKQGFFKVLPRTPDFSK